MLLRKSNILYDQFSRLQKFCTNEDFLFSYFIFLSPNTFFFKKIEYGERCSVKSSTICEQQFILIVSFVFSKKSKIRERDIWYDFFITISLTESSFTISWHKKHTWYSECSDREFGMKNQGVRNWSCAVNRNGHQYVFWRKTWKLSVKVENDLKIVIMNTLRS